MAQTYARIQKQIAALQAEAERMRKAEKDDVIARIREAIRVYTIEPRELFGGASLKFRGRAVKVKASGGAKYGDGTGNEWGGRGPRPQWLRDALESGRSIEEFDLRGKGGTPSAAVGTAPGVKRRKKKLPVKFKDDAGNRWTGRGSQPRWLRDALASGKKVDDFRA